MKRRVRGTATVVLITMRKTRGRKKMREMRVRRRQENRYENEEERQKPLMKTSRMIMRPPLTTVQGKRK